MLLASNPKCNEQVTEKSRETVTQKARAMDYRQLRMKPREIHKHELLFHKTNKTYEVKWSQMHFQHYFSFTCNYIYVLQHMLLHYAWEGE